MHPLIKTAKTNCKDCCKCIRHCNVKAICVKDGHAHIVPERCILDGKCVQICPQNAKNVISKLDDVKALLKSGEFVVMSLAPSFPVVVEGWKPFQVYRALKQLGFSEIEETSIAAYYVAQIYQKLTFDQDFIISSDCPSVVNLIEIYYPHLLQYLAPIDSPMDAHAKMLRKGFKEIHNKDIKIVFVGPCIAKIQEAERTEHAPDYVISFLDVIQWFEEENINPANFDATPIKSEFTDLAARMYPIEGGLLKSVGLEHFSSKYISATGFERCNEFLKRYDLDSKAVKLAELMVCEDGCVNGPLSGNSFPPLARKKIFEYAISKEHLPVLFDYDSLDFDLTKTFKNRYFKPSEYSEEQIEEVLRNTGKYKKEEEMNCGACGYDLCRDKAIAVLDGMAEIDMCIPYMKKKAESRAERIIDLSPNGVLEVNGNDEIIQYNNTFREMFGLPKYLEIAGKKYQDYIDVQIFRKERINKTYFPEKSEKFNKQLEIVNYQLEDDTVQVALVIDVTQKLNNKKNIDNLKKETIDKTTDVIHKQMRVAQEIASLLGETTAETKATLLELMNVFKKEVD
ncbi:MAG: PAS domain-containing protein [Candidatus Cloacimonetes bacterium]|nr:PAS domain-containing protein [Candidatus Cloacimonadota bacterium]